MRLCVSGVIGQNCVIGDSETVPMVQSSTSLVFYGEQMDALPMWVVPTFPTERLRIRFPDGDMEMCIHRKWQQDACAVGVFKGKPGECVLYPSTQATLHFEAAGHFVRE